jgi:hypothetical protein
MVAALVLALMPGSAAAQKTDSVTVQNGDRMLGEIKELQRGQLKFSTDAMSTVYVEWPKVVTVRTDKIFEIELGDGTVYFGSLGSGVADSVVIAGGSRPVSVPTQSIVSLTRIKPTFWDALDGNINLGVNFTQQSASTDLTLSGTVRYAARTNPDSAGKSVVLALDASRFHITKLTFNSSFSRQDDTDDIQRNSVTLAQVRQLADNWFWLVSLAGENNSQLSLDYRGTLAGGVGRYFARSNKLDFGAWVGPAYSREQFTGESPDNSIPFILAADAEYFTWGTLDTNVSSQLSVMPILNQWGRWRVNFNVTASREVVNNFYINLGVTEAYDSDPTAADANKNDFSFNTSFGWSF